MAVNIKRQRTKFLKLPQINKKWEKQQYTWRTAIKRFHKIMILRLAHRNIYHMYSIYLYNNIHDRRSIITSNPNHPPNMNSINSNSHTHTHEIENNVRFFSGTFGLCKYIKIHTYKCLKVWIDRFLPASEIIITRKTATSQQHQFNLFHLIWLEELTSAIFHLWNMKHIYNLYEYIRYNIHRQRDTQQWLNAIMYSNEKKLLCSRIKL